MTPTLKEMQNERIKFSGKEDTFIALSNFKMTFSIRSDFSYEFGIC